MERNMKTSDYVAQFLADQGIADAFVLTGGCIVHIIDSIARGGRMRYVPVQHEQAGAMAADAYARVTGNLGVALTTSGPGATNLLTGVCCSYYDSIPVLFITGQVPTSQLKRDSQSRQVGFQETDVVSIFQPVTKYAKLIDDARMIRYELEKAVYLARSGRPGPVLLDICDDVQRAQINPDELESFHPPAAQQADSSWKQKVNQVIDLINQSARPVIMFGGGIRLAGAVDLARRFVESSRLPFTLTWAAMDYLPHDNDLYVGGFGVTSGRPGNFAVQNADLVVAIGTRLDTHEAGSNLKTFAREAKKVVVDIDPAEQEKYAPRGMHVDALVTADARDFLAALVSRRDELVLRDRSAWLGHVRGWKEKYPICTETHRRQPERVNPYVFMEELSRQAADDALIVTDCGSNLIWTMQGFSVRGNQRVMSAFNHSPMGYSLPASMGAALAAQGKQTVCITGDGGLQINIQEFATIHRHRIDVKIFVMNNHGHGIIQGTQDNWLDGRHHAANPKFGLPDPDCERVAQAYGIPTECIDSHDELAEKISRVLRMPGPVLCNVNLLPGPQIAPKLLYGRPIEDSDPLLPRDEFRANMLVKPIT
jgi:acetolactate synthase-1/2/3 large subunit